MDTFIQNIGSFPTLLFTGFIVLVLVYWLGAMIGLLDIELLDFDLSGSDADLELETGNDVSSASALAGLMLRLGLQGVPVTIILSLIALFGWLISYYTQSLHKF